MDITYLGHSSFKIRGKTAIIVTDPFTPDCMGVKFPKVEADIVTVSHSHSDHNYISGVSGDPVIVKGPGEYEIKGVNICGLSTFHDEVSGKKRGRNTIYRLKVDKISIAHCGDLGHKLDDETIEILGEIDIIMIPVGGIYTITASEAKDVVGLLEPKIIIPMHYNTDRLNQEIVGKLTKVDDFLKEMDTKVDRLKRLNISYTSLPEEQVVVVLE